MAERVSIPHRYGKNEKVAPVIGVAKRVSIPHRYGKNCYLYLHHRKGVKFPFLIGTVRTHRSHKGNTSRKEFPFLIGTVRTRLSCNFQRLCHVSIPHRYGKNGATKNNTLVFADMFPFLIGTVRTRRG